MKILLLKRFKYSTTTKKMNLPNWIWIRKFVRNKDKCIFNILKPPSNVSKELSSLKCCLSSTNYEEYFCWGKVKNLTKPFYIPVNVNVIVKCQYLSFYTFSHLFLSWLQMIFQKSKKKQTFKFFTKLDFLKS